MTRTWDETSLKKMNGIHPDLRRVLDAALPVAPFPFHVIEGLRTVERQKELVRKGASQTMRSRHITGHAVDLVPWHDQNGNGKVDNAELWSWPLFHQLAPVILDTAKHLGVAIEWGGNWKTFKDGPHWQLTWAAYP